MSDDTLPLDDAAVKSLPSAHPFPSPPAPDTGWIIELQDRQRRGGTRYIRVQRWPLTLGRGYGADILVDDAYMAAAHARVQPADNGQWHVEDLGTLNGVKRLGCNGRRTAKAETGLLTVGADEWLETGRTRWRLVRADTPVAPERALVLRQHAPLWVCAGMALLAVLATLWATWFNAFDEFKPLTLLTPALTSTALLLAWSGAWALLGRVLHSPPHFMQHLGWAGFMSLAATALTWLADTLAFAADLPQLNSGSRPLWILIMAIAVLGHVTIAFGRPGRRSWWLVAGLCTGSMALSVAETWQTQRQWMPESFMSTIRPAGWQAVQGQALEALMERAAADRLRIDALRSHESSVDDDDDEP